MMLRSLQVLHRHRGFTLLEILVVISILSLVVMLVSPLAADRLQKAEARAEFLEFKSSLKLHSLKAFTQGAASSFLLNDSVVTIKGALGDVTTSQYQHIEFPNQQFVMNANGYPSIGEIRVSVNTVERVILFHEIIGASRDAVYAE